jgi:nicotinate-nucleotide adenylyltransferase
LKLAIFGGTFDPIHQAHLAAAREAADRFGLERVLLIPASQPPHKRDGAHASYEDRVRMAELACAGDSRLQVSRIEEGTTRSYSIDTIEKLRAGLSAEDELYFIIGADAFSEIATWHRWQDVARAVRFLVISRPGFTYTAPETVKFEALDTLMLDVSSSAIRHALSSGEKPPSLPPAVLAYILEHRLYGVPGTWR